MIIKNIVKKFNFPSWLLHLPLWLGQASSPKHETLL